MLTKVFDIKKGDIITITGAGGKTSLMFSLARELSTLGRVLVTTTTKIFTPKIDEYEELILPNHKTKGLAKNIFIYGEKIENNKLHSLSYDKIFDLKKEYKEYYRPKNKPEIINIPSFNYIAVRGKGNPNEEDGSYQQAIQVLYAVVYTLKMSYKTDYQIKGFYQFVVPPLEGFWWQENVENVDYLHKENFNWISVIRLPDFITKKDFDWAVKRATIKKKIDCSKAEFFTFEEGLCVQMMHQGSFDDEINTVEIMNQFLQEKGYRNDFNKSRLHHEIYLSDARKNAPEKWKTVIRHPICKIDKK